VNAISFNLGFILFFALIVWVFLSNDLYLKLFFFKKNKRKRRNENSDDEIFEQVYGGESIPQYIKQAILKSQDKHQLLSLYLASKSIIDLGVYNKVIKDLSSDKYEFCALIFINPKHLIFNWIVWVVRCLSIVGSLILFALLFDKVFLIESAVISNSDQLVTISIIIMFILMPYNIFSKSKFFDKLCSIFVFLSSILVALFSVVYIQNYSGDIIFNKLFLSVALVNLIILLGAYSYIGYAKLEYMVNFFELLKVNLAQNRINTVSDITTPTTPSTSETTIS
jgi:hypothetical protein